MLIPTSRPARRLTLALFAALLAARCSDRGASPADDIPNVPADSVVVLTDSIEVIVSPQAYEVVEAHIAGQVLVTQTQVSGGCGEHAYSLFVSTAFSKSFPVQTNAYLVHESDDPCDGLVREQRSYDLAPLLEHYRSVYGRHDPIRIHLYRRSDRETGTTEFRYEPAIR